MLEHNLLLYVRILRRNFNDTDADLAAERDRHYGHFISFYSFASHHRHHRGNFHFFLPAKLGVQIPNVERFLDTTPGRIYDDSRRCWWMVEPRNPLDGGQRSAVTR